MESLKFTLNSFANTFENMPDIVKACWDKKEPAETRLALKLSEPTQLMVPMPSFEPQAHAQPDHALWGSAAARCHSRGFCCQTLL